MYYIQISVIGVGAVVYDEPVHYEIYRHPYGGAIWAFETREAADTAREKALRDYAERNSYTVRDMDYYLDDDVLYAKLKNDAGWACDVEVYSLQAIKWEG